ncbi:MAG: NAD(P)H-hydrate dehydratase [Rubrivivax sp.]|nr:NAD(P)H-hydrate dehydratase [Rubrivivax sp.]
MRPALADPARPQRVRPEDAGHALHDAEASRAIEARALQRTAPHALMARAGLATARLALARWPRARRVAVWAGPGNNGGDALVAALHMHQAGLEVVAVRVDASRPPPADAAHALQQALGAGLAMRSGPPGPADADLVIDGLLGLGVRCAPQGPIQAAIAELRGCAAPVLAIDLPSGLDPATGQPVGDESVRATATLSLLTLKPGLFTAQGRDLAGEVWHADLGVHVPSESATARLSGAEAWRSVALPRRHATHKGSFGDVFVVAGAPGMRGAAELAGRAALRAGAGRVYLSLLDAAVPATSPATPELMLREAAWLLPRPRLRAATVVCGCGGGDAVRSALPALLSAAGRLVLDADALNAIAADPSLQRLLAARHDAGLQTVLTPHPLEAARLLGIDAAAVQSDRLAAADRLARHTRSTVLLKGSGTVITEPERTPAIIASGNALLATPGSGDVLAGWIGGLWSASGASAPRVAEASAWLHGHAADAHGAIHGLALPLPATVLVDAMARAAGDPFAPAEG